MINLCILSVMSYSLVANNRGKKGEILSSGDAIVQVLLVLVYQIKARVQRSEVVETCELPVELILYSTCQY